ncbi:hypothetical protein DERF_012828 [Dermatophagoides farinae]|uniref:Uncharacterized protein n=1 Tax=Dermatophagoides farinae TaxID=6954 RepID=A0A922HU84_DERFA|nr:hypothetical protein DERF_012828 [Dermatophagoides farinae]
MNDPSIDDVILITSKICNFFNLPQPDKQQRNLLPVAANDIVWPVERFSTGRAKSERPAITRP